MLLHLQGQCRYCEKAKSIPNMDKWATADL